MQWAAAWRQSAQRLHDSSPAAALIEIALLNRLLPSRQVRGYDPQLVQAGSAASVPRTCATPADISMDTTRLQARLLLLPWVWAARRLPWRRGACAGAGCPCRAGANRQPRLLPAARLPQAVLGVRPTPFEAALREIYS